MTHYQAQQLEKIISTVEPRGLFLKDRMAKITLLDRPCPPDEYKYLMSKQIGVCPYNINPN
jgi:hypothetical protein